MTNQERQRQMDFILEQQARFESSIQVGREELAQIRRVLISAIRLARRERSESRAKFNALTDAQIRSEEQFAAFQAQSAAFQAQSAASQAQVSQALSDLSQAVVQTNRRIDPLEGTRGNGDGSQG
jgi:ABC-type transporter Mla subunit MlaD